MARSLNMAMIIGNLTRDPEMRYTPAGRAVVSFGVATNRSWKTADGVARDEAEFHNVVAWSKLAEIISQHLKKGDRVYIQGRLQTRNWEGKDGAKRNRTEIVVDDMLMLGSRRAGAAAGADVRAAGTPPTPVAEVTPPPPEGGGNPNGGPKKSAKRQENVNPKEMPF